MFGGFAGFRYRSALGDGTSAAETGRLIDADAEVRRTTVSRLLSRGLDSKLLKGGCLEALRLLTQARDLSLSPVPLPWPWPQLCVYRLAYLMMRQATTASEVREVLRLLDDIDADRWPDPLQYAFLCCVLLRLRADAKGVDRVSLQRRIEETLAAMMIAGENPHGVMHGPLQTETVNLAELLTFAAGTTYSLEGLGRLPTSHVPSRIEDAFVLVGTHGIDAEIAMTDAFAVGEFEARAAEADIAFEWVDHPRLVKPTGLRLSSAFMRHLPDICQRQTLEVEKSVAALDVLIFRQREKFADVLRRTRGLDIPRLDTIPLLGPQRYGVHPALRIVGLVRLSKWRPQAVLKAG